MRGFTSIMAGLLTITGPASAQTGATPIHPMSPGVEPRPASWNGDGAPRPPGMWRGHGGDRWPTHYQACNRRYASYDHRTDTYRENGKRVRCAL